MRVLILHNIITPHILPYYEGLSCEPGIDVTVWFLAERHSTRRWDTSVSGSFRWEILPGWTFNVMIQRREKETIHFNPSLLWRIPRGKFDLVVLCGWSSPSYLLAQLICEFLRIPTILWIGSTPGAQTFGGRSGEKLVGWRCLMRPLRLWWIRQAKGYISYGTRSRKYLVELGANPDRIHCVWNTVDVDRLMVAADAAKYQREERRATLGIAPGDKLLLYVGLFQPLKYLDTLIQAYVQVNKQRSDVVLGLVGYGESEDDLRSMASKTESGRIKFFGYISLNDLPTYYTMADVFVLPSVDIWGLVVNEAMACGLPIIASESVGCTDDLVIQGVNGLIFQHGDVNALSKAILTLTSNNLLCQEMGMASRAHIQRYTYRHAIPAFTNAVRQASTKG
jgi:glycosyltransferase involved in cell wall biosynthesis